MKPYFHPFELAVCGYSGSGKTTLLTRLIAHLAPTLRLGYAKHSGHAFTLDQAGKDTARARDAGAVRIFITNDRATALTTGEPLDVVQRRTMFDDCDAVLVEGWKSSPLPRLVMIDAQGAILEPDTADAHASDRTARRDASPHQSEQAKGRGEPSRRAAQDEAGPVIGWVGAHAIRPAAIPGDAPYVQRDDIGGIAALVTRHFDGLAGGTPLYGLILAGGRSTRMQRDKALLAYRGRTQVEHMYDLVGRRCASTFVSARAGQWAAAPFAALPQIHDTIQECGPTGGILSAMQAHPEAAWLVVACDLPYLDGATLDALIRQRAPLKVATAYTSSSDGLPEPLCAIYEPRARSRLFQFVAIGYTCPRKMLINSNARLLALANPRALDNVNRPEEYERAMRELGESGKA
ncbi:MAG: molybdopterin-guanine dinucleotide biosynthesis protein B [Lentisphaerae bacterium]|nr:molybdopterin-guanine dinucleotide biosynthesis protein B [Lentisphaerota bacterium]